MQSNTDLITLTAAAKFWPGRPHVATIWRACRKGIKAADGTRVFLTHTRFGGRIFTTRADVQQFGVELAKADMRHFAASPAAVPSRRPPTPEHRRDEVRAASDAVRRAGI